MQAIHGLGARKFSLVGLSLLGCVPHEISTHGKNDSRCIQEENNAALLFNDKLKPLVDHLNKELTDSKFIFINSAVIRLSQLKLQGISNIFYSDNKYSKSCFHKTWGLVTL